MILLTSLPPRGLSLANYRNTKHLEHACARTLEEDWESVVRLRCVGRFCCTKITGCAGSVRSGGILFKSPLWLEGVEMMVRRLGGA